MDNGRQSTVRDRLFFRRLKEMWLIRTGNRLLDVGVGSGGFMRLVMDSFLEIKGVEIAPDQLAAMAPLLQQHITTVDIQKGRLGFPDSYFDCVTLFDVLEHLTRPYDALEELKRVLKPGGSIILTTPNLRSISRLVKGKKWIGTYDPTHKWLFDSRSLRFLLERSGFSSIVIKTYFLPSCEGSFVYTLNELMSFTEWGGMLWCSARR